MVMSIRMSFIDTGVRVRGSLFIWSSSTFSRLICGRWRSTAPTRGPAGGDADVPRLREDSVAGRNLEDSGGGLRGGGRSIAGVSGV